MKEYCISWKEKYSININANSKEEATQKFEALTEKEMKEAYIETTFYEVIEA